MNNDTKIMKLKEQIKTKKDKLNSIKKFNPITNCIIDLDGIKHNIQVLNKDGLIMLASKLNSYNHAAKDLGYDLVISGYSASDWIGDIKAKLDILTVKDEEKKLEAMEKKLTALLSNDKKVELEINEIESMLN